MSTLYDMETYDFYDVCVKKNMASFSCVRFVTDWVLEKAAAEVIGINEYLDKIEQRLPLPPHFSRNQTTWPSSMDIPTKNIPKRWPKPNLLRVN